MLRDYFSPRWHSYVPEGEQMNKREQEERSAMEATVFLSVDAVRKFLHEPRTRLPPFNWRWDEQTAWLSGIWMARDARNEHL
jgi:hypothetical protein